MKSKEFALHIDVKLFEVKNYIIKISGFCFTNCKRHWVRQQIRNVRIHKIVPELQCTIFFHESTLTVVLILLFESFCLCAR